MSLTAKKRISRDHCVAPLDGGGGGEGGGGGATALSSIEIGFVGT